VGDAECETPLEGDTPPKDAAGAGIPDVPVEVALTPPGVGEAVHDPAEGVREPAEGVRDPAEGEPPVPHEVTSAAHTSRTTKPRQFTARAARPRSDPVRATGHPLPTSGLP